MKLKALCTTLLLVCAFAGTGMAQDLGPAPDTVALVLTQAPSANAGQDTLEIQLWVYNDDLIKGANMGFAWDNPTFDLVSAEPTTLADNAFDLVVAFYEDGQLATTNANDRFLFGGSRLFNGMAGDTQRRHWATYRFVTSNWTINDSIAFDTNAFNSGSQWVFVNANTVGYQAIWEQGEDGSFVVYDPDRPTGPTGNLVLGPDSLKFSATEGGAAPAAQSVSITSDGDPLNFTFTPLDTWITASAADGTTPASIDVSVNNAGLTPGTYVDSIEVASGDAGNSPQYLVVVLDVGQAPPEIACPTETVVDTACVAEPICIPLPVTGADSVVSKFGTWSNNELCWILETDFAGVDTVVAYNSGGFTICAIDVDLTLNNPALIVGCPTEPVVVDVCGPQEVCLPLTVTDADSVTSTQLGVFDAVNNEICWAITESINVVDTIIAWSECGNDTCIVPVTVNVNPLPSIVDCPIEPVVVSVCGPQTVCLPLTINDATSVTSTQGGVYANGEICWDVAESISVTDTIIAVNDCGADTCTVDVSVTVNEPAAITCPVDPIVANITAATDVCIPLPINEVDSVTSTQGGSYNSNTQELCWFVDQSIAVIDTVIAWDECGNDTCILDVTVNLVETPVIDCPTDPIAVSICEPQTVCYPLAISGADAVTSTQGGTYVDGQLCWEITEAISVLDTVIATNAAGADTCVLDVTVVIDGPPVIVCPTDPIVVDINGPQTVCYPLIISDYDSVKTTQGGTYTTEGDLCWDITESIAVLDTVIAYNECGTDTCVLDVTVNVGDAPVIDCPTDPIFVSICEPGTVCYPLTITDFETVTTTQGGTYADGQLCWEIAGDISVLDTVIATNAAGADTCVLNVTVTIDGAPEIACPTEPIVVDICGPQTVCYALGITDFDSVKTALGGTYVDGQVCWDITESIAVIDTVYAFNECGMSMCVLDVTVNVLSVPTAGFTVDPTTGDVPLMVSFTNTSITDGTAEYEWMFGDGNMSTEFEPMHTYEAPGCYDVTLIAVNECGADTMMMVDAVCVSDTAGVTPTNEWINVYCATPTLDEVPLNPGDMIYAYDPDGVLCGLGEVKADGSYGFMPIYRDDIFTAEDEGAEPGDEISFAINGQPVLASPTIIWTENGDNFELCAFTTEQCKTLSLVTGWNLVSWNVQYMDDIQNFIAPFAADVEVILGFDAGAQTFDPNLVEFSTLSNVDYYNGYWIKVTRDVDVEICGLPVDEEDVIQIDAGWNLVSYWPTMSMTPENALASIYENVEVVLGYDPVEGAQVHIPGDEFNTLDMMRECFGYWIKSSADDALNYFGFPAVIAGGTNTAAKYGDGVTSTRNFFSVYGKNLTVDGRAIGSGTSVEVRTESGTLVGAGEYNGGILKFTPVYGKDAMVEGTSDYPTRGEQLFVHVDGQQVYPELTFAEQGSRVQLSALSTTEGGAGNLPNSFALNQNYPNPFNPSTVISFTLPQSGHVELAVYNVLGQHIKTLVSGQRSAGEHEVRWDATDESGATVSTGIYLYRLETSGNVETKKMMLMK